MSALSGRLETLTRAREFTFAGNAYLTLKSMATGTRFTYRLARKEARDGGGFIYHVSGLTGPDNDQHYAYLGTIWQERQLRRGRRSVISVDAPIVRAFMFYLKMLWKAPCIPSSLEVWHDGRCGRCGRHLTVPESVARGIGPDCAGQMADADLQTNLAFIKQLEVRS